MSDNSVLVEAVNAVDENQKDTLTRNLEALRKMDSAELKSAYRNRLKDGPPEGSKGAGLGFIEIARKSDMWDFEFVKEHGKILFFYFPVHQLQRMFLLAQRNLLPQLVYFQHTE